MIADFNCEVPEPPQKKKRALPAAERLEKAAAEGGLSLPPFPIAWENLDRLKEFYKLTEEDTAKLLLQVLGPDPRAVSIDPEKYPEMVKLWNGSRQESMI